MATINLDFLEKQNTPPVQSGSNSFEIDSDYTFTLQDFTTETNPPYQDLEGDALNSIKITSLPALGTLKLNGFNVILDQEILSSDLSSGNFAYEIDNSGNNYTDNLMSFQVSDVGSNEFLNTSNTISFFIKLEDLGETTVVGSNSLNLTNKSIHTFTKENFTTETTPIYSNPYGNDAYSVKITSTPFNGELIFNNSPLSLNDSILIQEIENGLLIYETNEEYLIPIVDTFNFSIADQENLIFYSGGVFTLNVEAYQSNPPNINQETEVSVNINTDYVFTRQDLVTGANYNDQDGDLAVSVRFTSLPNLGEIKLDGVSVSQNQEILLTDVDLGILIYNTVDNQEGSFEMDYQIKDSSGMWSN